MNSRTCERLLSALLASALLGTTATPRPVPAGGDLLVSPTRVVLVGADASAKLTLRNTGIEATTYLLSLVRMRMGEHGEMSVVDAPREGELFADELVRLSPDRARVPAGGEQTVRLKAKVPPVLSPGEYRAHLLFRPVIEEGPKSGGPALAGDEKVRIRLRPVVGVTVPVLLRIGDLGARVRMTELRLLEATDAPRLEVTLEREGTSSVYGGLVVQLVSKEGRSETVGGLGGVAIYTPNAKRIVEVPIRLPAPAKRAGRLRVEYRATDDAATLLASRDADLP